MASTTMPTTIVPTATRFTKSTRTPRAALAEEPLDGEVFGPGIEHHDRAGRLLRMELPFVRHRDADPLGIEQAKQRLLVLELGAGRIAERVARSAIALRQHLLD